MKTSFGLIIIACLLFSASALQEVRFSSSDDKVTNFSNNETAEFQRLAEQWKEIYNGKDATQFATMYAEDAQYISAHVAGYIANGRDAIIANFQKGMDSGGALDAIEILSVSLSCELATVICRYAGLSGGQKVEGRNLLVLKKMNGRWLIVSHITVVRD